jgi:hypothetical protein
MSPVGPLWIVLLHHRIWTMASSELSHFSRAQRIYHSAHTYQCTNASSGCVYVRCLSVHCVLLLYTVPRWAALRWYKLEAALIKVREAVHQVSS